MLAGEERADARYMLRYADIGVSTGGVRSRWCAILFVAATVQHRALPCIAAAAAATPLPLQVDPFFVPTTEEELEEYGTEAGGPANLARRLIDAVRRRKGLPVEEKVVAKATKQRTLKRNV
jgi:hypothetical protein